MGTVTLEQAKADLDAVIARVGAGEVVVILLGGRPIARFVPPDWSDQASEPPRDN